MTIFADIKFFLRVPVTAEHQRSTSGFMPHSSLSPCYQSSVGQSEGLSIYHRQLLSPAPLGVRPAYCFHCLQFGSVYTINPV